MMLSWENAAGIKLETVNCCACGVLFAWPDFLAADRRKNGEPFYCPNGHPQSFRPSEVTKLKERMNDEIRQRLAVEADLREERMCRQKAEAELARARACGSPRTRAKEKAVVLGEV